MNAGAEVLLQGYDLYCASSSIYVFNFISFFRATEAKIRQGTQKGLEVMYTILVWVDKVELDQVD